MSALDSCHSQIVHALEKAGWQIVPKPVDISSLINTLSAVIEAHRMIEDGDLAYAGEVVLLA